MTISSLRIRERDEGCVVQADLAAPAGTDLDALVAPLADRADVADLEVG